jgi:hypothetical protein
MSKLNKAQMHQRPTYETLVKDTILEPKDEIALPDRQATILRKTQQLSRYDDAEFLDLEKDNEQIAKEQAQQNTINAAAGSDTGGSLGQTRAFPPGGHQRRTFSRPPPPSGGGQGQPPSAGGQGPSPPPAQPPAAGGMPRFTMAGGQGQTPHAPLQTHSTTSGPPGPPSNGAKIMTGRKQKNPQNSLT